MKTKLLALLGALLLAGCSSGEPTGPAPAGDATPSLDELRSLPYASAAPDEPSPDSSGVVHVDERAWPGYSLYVSRDPALAELVDMEGQALRRWSDPEARYWVRAELAPNDDILVIGATDTGKPVDPDHADRYLARQSWRGETRWKTDGAYHHDVEVLGDGRLLTLAYTYLRDEAIHAELETRDDELVLLDAEGHTLGTRSLLRALRSNPAEFTLQEVAPTKRHNRTFVDLIHANTVQWMRHPEFEERHALYDLDNVLVTSRNQDAVLVVNWESGELVWAWGQGELSGPHDAQILDDGNMLIFDNGLARGWSRIIELDPVTKDIVWEYRAEPREEFYSRARGTCQRLPNGNTLVADSDSGRAFEVTREGEKVWEFLSPHAARESGRRSIIGRIKRYAPTRLPNARN